MKDLLDILKETKLDNRVRLGMMSILVVNEWVEFKRLKQELGLSDGNLASHVKALEREDYIDTKKEFVGKKPQTSYRATDAGRLAFQTHLNALEELLKLTSPPDETA